MAKQIKFSIIIPVRETGYTLIWECLPAIDNQQYDDFEVIILPDKHTQYDTTLLQQYKWLRILPTGPESKPAEKRDHGAKEAKGEILAFIDDDTYPKETWLEQADIAFREMDITVMGGPGIVPPNASPNEIAFDQVLRSKVGAGPMTYRFEEGKPRFVSDYPSMNYFIYRDLFLSIGGFDSSFWPGEDSKLNEKINKEGHKIYYNPNVVVYHHRRKTLKSFLYQHGQYGFHRGAFYAQGDTNSKELVYLIPSLFFVYLILFCLLLLAGVVFSWHPFYIFLLALPLLLYWILLNYVSILALLRSKNVYVFIMTAVAYISTHLVYGWQFINGYILEQRKHSKTVEQDKAIQSV